MTSYQCLSQERKDQIGQVLMAGFHGTTVTGELKDLVHHYKIGAIILFSRNLTDRKQTAALVRDIRELILQETGHPALIAIDQEGGSVVRLPDDCVTMPGSMALASLNDPDAVEEACFYAGQELASLGINFNLAPVLDLALSRKNPAIGTRCFSPDPEITASLAAAAVRGYHRAGILCCGKHFPGHGGSDLDSHVSLPVISQTWDELEAGALIPFRRAVDCSIDAMMAAHVLVPAVEPQKVPATMSKTMLSDCLRKRLGFQGLITTDCLEMDAICRYYGTENGAAAALSAGVDLVLISHTPELVKASIETISQKLADGTISSARLADAASHVLACRDQFSSNSVIEHAAQNTIPKRNAVPNADSADDASRANGMAAADRLFRRTVRWADASVWNSVPYTNASLLSSPLFVGFRKSYASKAVSFLDRDLYFELSLQKRFKGTAVTLSRDPEETDILELCRRAADSSCVILGTYNAYLSEGQTKAVQALTASHVPIVLAALGNPYDLELVPDSVPALASYEYSARAFRVIGDLLERI